MPIEIGKVHQRIDLTVRKFAPGQNPETDEPAETSTYTEWKTQDGTTVTDPEMVAHLDQKAAAESA